VFAVGQVINEKYRLLRLVGDGGMGAVYEAHHELLGTRVAIKVLHPELVRRTGLADRFMQEARVSAQIRSPHVVQVLDVDRTSGGVAYIVMELLEGEPLSSLLDRQRRLPIPMACDYTRQILEALEAAHALGVIHRDLKPENVFVTFVAGRPVLKLIDFGIAKLRRTDVQPKNLTVAGVMMGTAEYMAPEQVYAAERVDARADLYSVGVMLYEMIAGVRPVQGMDARSIAAKVERGEVQPLVHAAPDVPREVAGLVHRAMAARPELRFTSATEMRLALAAALEGKRANTPPGGGSGGNGAHDGPRGSTVMGAPTEGAFAAPPPPPPPPQNPMAGATVGAPPAFGGAAYGPGPSAYGAPPAYGPPPAFDGRYEAQGPSTERTYAPGPLPGYTPPPIPSQLGPPGRRKRGGSLLLLVGGALVLGVGVVVAFVVSNGSATGVGESTLGRPPAAELEAGRAQTTQGGAGGPLPGASGPAAGAAGSEVPPLATLSGTGAPATAPPQTTPGGGTARPRPAGDAGTTPGGGGGTTEPSTPTPFPPMPTELPRIPIPGFGDGDGGVFTIPTNLPFPIPFPQPGGAPQGPAGGQSGSGGAPPSGGGAGTSGFGPSRAQPPFPSGYPTQSPTSLPPSYPR
jgi:serine/threonine-protein kinase